MIVIGMRPWEAHLCNFYMQDRQVNLDNIVQLLGIRYYCEMGILGGHLCAISECSVVGILCAFLESSVDYLTALHIFWRAVLIGVSAGCEVLAGKGGWCLCALRGFNRQERKLDGWRRKAQNYGKLDEARFLGKMAKCEISETYVNIDRT